MKNIKLSFIVLMLLCSEAYSSPIETVAACLILEAGGEPAGGMEAVFGVIKNRAKSNDSAKWQAIVLKPKQFSCFNSGVERAIAKAKIHPYWNKALDIVKNNSSTDYSNGSTHYHVYRGKRKVSPSWTTPKLGGRNQKAIEVGTLGDHVFLKNVD